MSVQQKVVTLVMVEGRLMTPWQAAGVRARDALRWGRGTSYAHPSEYKPPLRSWTTPKR